MKQTIHVSIDSNGRAKASSKNLGNQYETGVAEFEIDLSADWQDESYFYYLVVIPPESTGIKQYAVPLSRDFIYLISSNITWYLGTFKFLIIVMNKELDVSGQIPTDGVVSISDEWEGEVNKSPLKLAELTEQPENPNFTLLYTDLMALRNSVEQIGNYAQTQGDYAKGVGEQLLLDKENGVFNGKDGEKGEKGDQGPQGIQGEQGPQGLKGEAGPQGEKGEQGANGLQGETGNDGYSPTVTVKINTSTQYVLEITYKDETGNTQTLVTPNLKGKDGEGGGGGGTTGEVPTKLSELTNDTGFITNTVDNLVNYYLKTEVYAKNEVNSLISNLTSFSTVIVTTLPTQNISTTTIYLIANTEQAESNYYDEYLYINNVWEKIGTTQTKLDNYFTKEETIEKIDEAIEGIGAGIQEIPIASNETLGGIKVGKGLEITEEGVLKVENIVVEATGASSNPIGTVIPFMGTTPPKDYLTCDGRELNIANYLELATHFKNQFGSINYFGGDGITTFAIPDMRDEFIRGYHGDKEIPLSGEVGIHQEATTHLFDGSYGTSDKGWHGAWAGGGVSEVPTNYDSAAGNSQGYFYGTTASRAASNLGLATTYTARPTNIAVLFCIKYTVSSEEIEVEGTVTEGSNKIPTSGAVKNYVDSTVTNVGGVIIDTYTGTGDYGEGNECVIDVGFIPSLILVSGLPAKNRGNQLWIYPKLLIGHGYNLHSSNTGSIMPVTVTVEGTTIKWYGEAAYQQGNVDKTEYIYTVFK